MTLDFLKIIGGIVIFFGILAMPIPKKEKEKPRFTVVNKYNGCNVVQYETMKMKYPQYVYLLDCKK